MKWYGRISGQKAHSHKKGRARAQQEDEGFCPSNTQSKKG